MQQNQQINNIKQRVLNKSKESNIIDVYHFFMLYYGYIPFEEFKKMDAFLKDELLIRLNKLNKPKGKGKK